MSVTTCPCCGSDRLQQQPERTQRNGIRLGGGRCQACGFSWTTIQGRISKMSRHTTETHVLSGLRRSDRRQERAEHSRG